jgi:hypothetical protein
MTSNHRQSQAEAPPSDEPGYQGPQNGPLDASEGVAVFIEALDRGDDWYPALLDVIARWTAASETVDDAEYEYLIAGEAFDWLRLAQRLLEAADDRVPEEDAERLLFEGSPPGGEDEDAFARAIGPSKHRAHLNYQYGVVVEETLLLAAELELQKAGTLAGSGRPAPEVEAYERVYGKPMNELLMLFRAEQGETWDNSISLREMKAFTYWCSKYRFKNSEPARVASDTRKALALLSQLATSRRRSPRRRADAAPIDVDGANHRGRRVPPAPRRRARAVPVDA